MIHFLIISARKIRWSIGGADSRSPIDFDDSARESPRPSLTLLMRFGKYSLFCARWGDGELTISKAKLHRPDCELVRLSKNGELRARRANINNPSPAFDMGANFQRGADKVISPGDKCRDCKARQRNLGRIFKPMCLSIMSYFPTII